MVNQILISSSIICGIIHTIAYSTNTNINLLFVLVTMIGISTSIWNHAVTCKIAKIIDRTTMCCAAIFDFYYITIVNKKCLILLLLMSISLYILAKYYRINTFHIMAHFTLTLTHILLI